MKRREREQDAVFGDLKRLPNGAGLLDGDALTAFRHDDDAGEVEADESARNAVDLACWEIVGDHADTRERKPGTTPCGDRPGRSPSEVRGPMEPEMDEKSLAAMVKPFADRDASSWLLTATLIEYLIEQGTIDRSKIIAHLRDFQERALPLDLHTGFETVLSLIEKPE